MFLYLTCSERHMGMERLTDGRIILLYCKNTSVDTVRLNIFDSKQGSENDRL